MQYRYKVTFWCALERWFTRHNYYYYRPSPVTKPIKDEIWNSDYFANNTVYAYKLFFSRCTIPSCFHENLSLVTIYYIACYDIITIMEISGLSNSLTSENYFTACATECYADSIVLIYGNNRASLNMCYARQYINIHLCFTIGRQSDSHAPYCIDNDISTYKIISSSTIMCHLPI